MGKTITGFTLSHVTFLAVWLGGLYVRNKLAARYLLDITKASLRQY